MSIIQEALKKIDPPAPVVLPLPSARVLVREPPQPHVPVVPADRQDRIAAKKSAPRAAVTASWWPVVGGALAAAFTLLCILVLLLRPGIKTPGSAPVKAVASIPETPEAATSHQETIYRRVEPATVVRSEPPDLILNGIMYLETGPRAIINNAIVGAGDSVGGATVSAINKKSVILTYNDVEITLNLK